MDEAAVVADEVPAAEGEGEEQMELNDEEAELFSLLSKYLPEDAAAAAAGDGDAAEAEADEEAVAAEAEAAQNAAAWEARYAAHAADEAVAAAKAAAEAQLAAKAEADAAAAAAAAAAAPAPAAAQPPAAAAAPAPSALAAAEVLREVGSMMPADVIKRVTLLQIDTGASLGRCMDTVSAFNQRSAGLYAETAKKFQRKGKVVKRVVADIREIQKRVKALQERIAKVQEGGPDPGDGEVEL